MKILNFSVIFLLLAVNCPAADLKDLQDLALNNRRVVKKYLANLEMAGQDQTIARSQFLPAANLSYTANLLDDDSLFENRENSVAYGAISWNLFAGWRDRYNLNAAGYRYEAESEKLAAIRQDIMLNVALRYLAIYAGRANLQVAQDSYHNLEKVYQDAENRLQVGLIKKNDLLKFKVDLDNAAITLKKAEAEVVRDQRLLNREVGSDVDPAQLTFGEFASLPQPDNYDELERKMLERRSDLQVLEKLAAAADQQSGVEKAAYYPRVDLTESYRKYEDDLLSTNGGYGYEELRSQLVFSVNLFDGMAKRARVAKAELEAKTVRDDLAELKLDLGTELHNLYRDLLVSLDNVAVADAGIGQAEENLRVTRLSYQEGLETESDLLNAIANLSRAHYNLAAAKSEVFDNYFRIVRTIEGF